MKVTLNVHYGDEYPDILPTLTLEAVEGELEESEVDGLLTQLRAVVCEAVDD